MTNKIAINPINILNVIGLNVLILSGNLPIFNDDADIAINATVTRETNEANKDIKTVNGNFNTTVIIKRADLKEINEAEIKKYVLKDIGVTELVAKQV